MSRTITSIIIFLNSVNVMISVRSQPFTDLREIAESSNSQSIKQGITPAFHTIIDESVAR